MKFLLIGLLAVSFYFTAEALICPAGYKSHKGSCYQVIQKNSDWYKAQNDCKARGRSATGGNWVGQLAEPRHKVSFKFLYSLVPGRYGDPRFGAWVGIKAFRIGGAFRYASDKKKVSRRFKWSPGEPNEYNSMDACVLVWKAGTTGYHDNPCRTYPGLLNYYHICQLIPLKTVRRRRYCSSNPQKWIPNTVRPTLFRRFIGTRVRLTCRPGFERDRKFKVVEVRCTRFKGKRRPKWVPCGACKEIQPYCRGNPSGSVKNSARPVSGTYSRTIGDTATLQCKVGFWSKHKVIARCVARSAREGEWASTSSCKLIPTYCNRHPNGVVPRSNSPTYKFSRELSSNVNINCWKGYRPKFGSVVRVVCAAHKPKRGVWITNNECREIPKYCNNHPHTSFRNSLGARRSSFSQSLGSEVRLNCFYGFRTVTGYSLLAKCDSWTVYDGAWTSRQTCLPIPTYCSKKPHRTVANSQRAKAGTFSRSVGSSVNINCKPGYKSATGRRPRARCVAHSARKGKWFSTDKCKEIEHFCNNMPAGGVSHVVPLKSGTFSRRYGAKVSLRCQNGWRPNKGKLIIVSCTPKTLEFGEWVSTQYCVPINTYCNGHPERSTNNVNAPARGSYSRKVGDTVRLTCTYGYRQTIYYFSAKCKAHNSKNGVWVTDGRCQPIIPYCNKKPEKQVTAGIRPPTFARTVGSRVRISCAKGWRPKSLPVFATCKPHNTRRGRWAIEGECICEEQLVKPPCHRFTYAAVQNGNECRCDWSYGKYGRAKSCNTRCSGSGEICGGYWANSVYRIQGRRAVFVGCYRDSGNRDINRAYFSDRRMSVGKCVKACLKRGYKYAGLQYGNQCFCGDRYGRYGKASPCNTRCANSRDTCGGSFANQVYALIGATGRGHLIGCFTDKGSRDLKGASVRGHYMTVGWCVNWCSRKGCEL